MNPKDSIQRFIFENANVRGEIVRLTDSFQTITTQHPYPPALRKTLGEALVVTCLLSAIIKMKGRLTVQFQGKHPLKLLLAQCNHQSELRGLVHWQGDLNEKEIEAALKKGTLAIMVSPDATTTTYQGIIAWQGHSFAQSVEIYFRDSEQLSTRLWLAVNDTSAAGILLQSLPHAPTTSALYDDAWEKIIHLTHTITPTELLSLDHDLILKRLYAQEEEVRIFSPTPIRFACTCSLERSENAIKMLGEKEAEEELKETQKIVVTCEFCNKEYIFDQAAVMRLFQN
jgi:molecular chaperone Hsp33